MGIIKITASLVMVALFAIAILSFVGNFATDNKVQVNINNDSDFATAQANLESNASQMIVDVNTSSYAFQEGTIASGDENTEGGTQHKGGIGTAINMAFDSLNTGYKKVFGEGFGIFFSLIIAIFLFMLAQYGWKAWRGNPD